MEPSTLSCTPAALGGLGTPRVPRPVCHPGGASNVRPFHTGGQETEQGMVPGQPGRQPPGDALGVTRPFLTDVVVFENYVIQEGMVIPQGAIRTRYHPETCPALPQQLARVSRGDTAAALAFVRTYGLLG
jgi:hypothetical protein